MVVVDEGQDLHTIDERSHYAGCTQYGLLGTLKESHIPDMQVQIHALFFAYRIAAKYSNAARKKAVFESI